MNVTDIHHSSFLNETETAFIPCTTGSSRKSWNASCGSILNI